MYENSNSVWRPRERLVLASSSVARLKLIREASIPVDTESADIDERLLELQAFGLKPVETALMLAEEKTRIVASRVQNRVVIGADEILELDNKCLHKLQHEDEAYDRLSLLSGCTHMLHSAVSIAMNGKMITSFYKTACMTIKTLTHDEKISYITHIQDRDTLKSAGAYRFEASNKDFFSKIKGDYSTILGLPMIPLLATFRSMNLLRI